MDEIISGMCVIFCVVIIILLTFLYSAHVFRYLSGWKKVKPYVATGQIDFPKVSVIIPFRNECRKLPDLIRQLEDQLFPTTKIEFLFVDDHSDDESTGILNKQCQKDSRFRILTNAGVGKKEALETGIHHASGTLILQTDADALPGKKWAQNMVSFSVKEDAGFVAGPVIMDPGIGLFQHFQALEHLSLTAVALGAYGAGKPVICSGANLLYEKKLITNTENPFRKDIPGGDDVFLLHNLKKTDPEKIRYIKNTDAVITIQPKKSLPAFLRQRSRWSGKSVYFQDKQALLQGLSVLLMNSAMALLWIGMIFDIRWVMITGALYILKSIPDYFLLSEAAKFFKKNHLMRFFVPVQLIYPWYVVITVLLGIFTVPIKKIFAESPNRWK